MMPPMNDTCAKCRYIDRGLNEQPCRTCTVSHRLSNNFEPAEGTEQIVKVESAIEGPYDQCKLYLDCAVQVLSNSRTGASSIQFTRDPQIIEKWMAEEW